MNKNEKLIKKLLYDWVVDNFGESEADDPSYNLDLLAIYLSENLEPKKSNKKKK